jgi:hypothetical protein
MEQGMNMSNQKACFRCGSIVEDTDGEYVLAPFVGKKFHCSRCAQQQKASSKASVIAIGVVIIVAAVLLLWLGGLP